MCSNCDNVFLQLVADRSKVNIKRIKAAVLSLDEWTSVTNVVKDIVDNIETLRFSKKSLGFCDEFDFDIQRIFTDLSKSSDKNYEELNQE